MDVTDLVAVEQVAELVHPDYPEDAAVFAERLRLYPDGCFVFETGRRIEGYAIAHPGLRRDPPGLNTLLRDLPAQPDTLHIHDVALLPQTRGLGLGVGITARLVLQALAAGVPWLSLIAVGGSLRFWEKNGFGVADQVAVRESLATYGETAVFMTRPVSQADR
jgi:GNAT superfamily N-acetyltransferase